VVSGSVHSRQRLVILYDTERQDKAPISAYRYVEYVYAKAALLEGNTTRHFYGYDIQEFEASYMIYSVVKVSLSHLPSVAGVLLSNTYCEERTTIPSIACRSDWRLYQD
jgi:hypothetical protein